MTTHGATILITSFADKLDAAGGYVTWLNRQADLRDEQDDADAVTYRACATVLESLRAFIAASPHPEPESAAPAVSDSVAQIRHVGRGLLVLFRGDTEVRDVGPTPGIGQRDRDEIIARYNAFPALTAQVASLTAERDAYRNAVAGHSERWEAAEAENERLRESNETRKSETGYWFHATGRANERAEAAEQQLAAKTAERDIQLHANIHLHGELRDAKENWNLEQDQWEREGATLREQLAASEAALREAWEDNDKLRAFAQSILPPLADEWGDVDMFDIQERATKHGLLREEVMAEPCGEHCACVGLDAEFPTRCYRFTDLYRGDAARAATKEPT